MLHLKKFFVKQSIFLHLEFSKPLYHPKQGKSSYSHLDGIPELCRISQFFFVTPKIIFLRAMNLPKMDNSPSQRLQTTWPWPLSWAPPGGLSSKGIYLPVKRYSPWAGKIPSRKWLSTPFLLRQSQGQRSQVGYSPWGSKRVSHD